jgi:hypothetical protein
VWADHGLPATFRAYLILTLSADQGCWLSAWGEPVRVRHQAFRETRESRLMSGEQGDEHEIACRQAVDRRCGSQD